MRKEPTLPQGITPIAVKKITSTSAAMSSSALSQKVSKTANGNPLPPTKQDSNGKAGSGSIKATASSPKSSASVSTSGRVLKPPTTSNKEIASINAEKKVIANEAVASDVTPSAPSRAKMAPLANISRTSSMRLAPTPSALSAPRVNSSTFPGPSGQSCKNLSSTLSAAARSPSSARGSELQKEVSVKQRVLQLEEGCNTPATNCGSRENV